MKKTTNIRAVTLTYEREAGLHINRDENGDAIYEYTERGEKVRSQYIRYETVKVSGYAWVSRSSAIIGLIYPTASEAISARRKAITQHQDKHARTKALQFDLALNPWSKRFCTKPTLEWASRKQSFANRN